MEAWDPLNTNNFELYRDDGLIFPDVGSWATRKYRKIATYSSIFSAGMRKKWDALIYLDLFAGAGKSRIKETEIILPGSPLLALNAKTPFDKYILCEQDDANCEALERRVSTLFPSRSVIFFRGDSNESAKKIFDAIPKAAKGFRVLSFCFIDPFHASQFSFATIELISQVFVDFLVLIPSYMDINRNFNFYFDKNNLALDRYLGRTDWRDVWRSRSLNPKMFGQFIVGLFCARMQSIGYSCGSPRNLNLVRFEEDRNQPLYHLGLFSRNPRGVDFWEKTRASTDKQLMLEF